MKSLGLVITVEVKTGFTIGSSSELIRNDSVKPKHSGREAEQLSLLVRP